MVPCSPAISEANRPGLRLSVHDRGAVEAQRHKWIESEKAGRDLGEWAIRGWVRQHWNGFLREKWLEHLEGRTFWIELDHDDFGLLQNARSSDSISDRRDRLAIEDRARKTSTSSTGRSTNSLDMPEVLEYPRDARHQQPTDRMPPRKARLSQAG